MDLSKRAEALNREVRNWTLSGVEVRADDDSTVRAFTGHASVVGAPYTIRDAFGEYTETIAPGAFTETIKRGADVAFLTNHGGLTMARTTAGTLRLSEDDHGLAVEADLDTRRSDVRDVAFALERGDIDQMSFGFRVTRQEWNDDYTERNIIEVNLHRGDVSVVNFGANPATDAAVRSLGLDGVDDAELIDALGACRAGTASAVQRQLVARVAEILAAYKTDPVARAAAELDLLRLQRRRFFGDAA